MIIALCASLKSFNKVISIGEQLTKKGFQVLYPWTIEEIKNGNLHPRQIPKFKLDNKSKAIGIHFEKIKKSNAILVINETKNKIRNYIGGNTLMEMGFAFVLNKNIFLLNPVPKMIYTEEIKAMKPTVLKGDVEKLNGLLG